MPVPAGYQANKMLGDQCYPAFELRNLMQFIQTELGESAVLDVYQQIGLGVAELNSVHFVYVWQVEYALEALRTLSKDTDIGARLGAANTVESLDVLLPHLRGFTRLNECLGFALKHPELVGSFSDYVVRVEQGKLWCRWLNTGKADTETFAFQFQHSVCSLLSLARQLVDVPIELTDIHLAQQELEHHFLKDYTGARVQHGCEFFEWAVALNTLDTPLNYDFNASPDKSAASLEPSLIDEVLYLIKGNISAIPALGEAATELHMSDRSLRRKLAQAGSSYQKLVDLARSQQAIKLILEDKLTVEQIAELLGYSDPSHFRQSFKHWLGLPPGHFLRLNS
ncbi:AraC family transcriptional regulator [Shewanella sp. WXL01]|uniref:AraC family transcriptional regulator n=1 Tax=Shewanella maritima TaxID=2520507 RepID=A0A411PKX1_9GAMM|nr:MULTISPECIES: AraC family transcriptional regulator [Shewanella]NKF51751.1 AraC family transcriptional regulator [Shewanella sp. WXL01]QBF84189.1 AraC family transcriptional regulator [Shewanella maritima]